MARPKGVGTFATGQKPETRKEAVLRRVGSMKLEEREELFDELLSTYCLSCGEELDEQGNCPDEECESNGVEGEDEEDEDDDDDGDDDSDADLDDADDGDGDGDTEDDGDATDD